MATVLGSPAAKRLRLNHRHEQIINWLILNPHRNLGDCAQEFGYTRSTLSNIIHSDLFQHVYRSRCEELGELATHTMGAKLSSLGVRLVEKIEERLDSGQASERLLIDGTRTILDSLGYTSKMARPPETGVQQHLHVHVSGSDLRAARERASEVFRGQSSLRIVEPSNEPIEIEQGESQGMAPLAAAEALVPL